MVLLKRNPEKNGVVVAIDADNLLISSAQAGQGFKGYSLEIGFENMFNWIESFGKILCIHLYLSKFQCDNNEDLWNSLWERYSGKFLFESIFCPRQRMVPDGTAAYGAKRDTVDNHLIYYTKKMAKKFDCQARYLCLAAGDIDYSSLLWEVKRKMGLEIAFALGSEESFSKVYRQVEIAGKHPFTHEELIYYFTPQKEKDRRK